MANKPYSQMTPAERLAQRIAQNKVIDAKAEAVTRRRQYVAGLRVDRAVQVLTQKLHESLIRETGEGLPARFLGKGK